MLPNALKQEEGPQSVLNAPQQKQGQGISLVQQKKPQVISQKNAAIKANEKDKNKIIKKKEKGPGYLEQLWRALIRPPNRLIYTPQQLGPTSFILDKTIIVKREDFKVINSRGYNLECSYFEPIQIANKPHPCVLYLHGNSSSRNEGIVLVQYLIPYGISLVLMDFSGCGISGGEYISLGYYEKYDAKQVMEHVKKWKPITEFGLWGRSMGAATTLMTSLQEDLSLRFIVIDSSFLSIKQLCEEIAISTYKIPKFILNWAYSYIRGKVQGKANFNLDECDALKAVQNPKNKPSALFLVAKGDTLISPTHSQKLYNLYRGSKRLLMFEGTHNSRRPREVNQEITKFFFNGFFDDYASSHLKVYQMIPFLPNFYKQDQANISQQKPSTIGNPPPIGVNSVVSEIHPSYNLKSSTNIPSNKGIGINTNGKDTLNHQTQIGSLQNKARYETSGQLMSKNVEKDEVLQEEEEEDNISHQIEKNKPRQNENVSNHISQISQKPVIPLNKHTTPNSIIAQPSIQADLEQYQLNIQTYHKQANSLKSNTNTINHNYNIHGTISNINGQLSHINSLHVNEDGTTDLAAYHKSIENNSRTYNLQNIHFSHSKKEFIKRDDSHKDQNDHDRIQSEDSKVYSLNIANLPSQNFQGNLNTEGQEVSPRNPKSQINFDSNNILINFQRYNNNNPNNNNVNGGIMNNGSIVQQNNNNNNQQDIKEEEDTQFNSKIDKFDQENVNQNIGLSGFYIPPDHGSQIQQNSAHGNNNNMVSSIANRVSGNSPIQHNHNPYPVIQQVNSQIGIALDNTMSLASPDRCASPQRVEKKQKLSNFFSNFFQIHFPSNFQNQSIQQTVIPYEKNSKQNQNFSLILVFPFQKQISFQKLEEKR